MIVNVNNAKHARIAEEVEVVVVMVVGPLGDVVNTMINLTMWRSSSETCALCSGRSGMRMSFMRSRMIQMPLSNC